MTPPTLERQRDLRNDDLVRATPETRELIVGLSGGRRAAAGLHVEVEVEHLRPQDFAVITRPNWLPEGHADRDEHLHHLAKVADAERALSELEGELQALRKTRMRAEIDGAKPPPAVDEDKLRAQRQESVVASRARLVRFADTTLGKIREQSSEVLAELEASVRERQARIDELGREMAALESAQDADDSARRWLRGQVYVVREDAHVVDPGISPFPPFRPGQGPSEVDQAVAQKLKAISGRAPAPVGI